MKTINDLGAISRNLIYIQLKFKGGEEIKNIYLN